jgi:enterochelin esterase family protein
MNRLFFPLASATAALLLGQAPPKPVKSPEVHEDRRVTFRFKAPNALAVQLALEGSKPAAMTKGEDGIWTITTDPMEPDIYGYTFIADGVSLTDPSTPLRKPNLLWQSSAVQVPGAGLPWEHTNVPHGALRHQFYHSNAVGDDRDYFVYTPPDYDSSNTKYPVLYLLHGFSDDASGWTSVGKAHFILDNLIAAGKVKPMLIVMTLGYGAPEIVSPDFGGFRDPDLRQRNFTRFRDALITEVIPQVEKNYRVMPDRNSRAIAGLSMGGAESLLTGLNNLDKFAYIGAFSSGGFTEEYEKQFPGLDAKANDKIRLLWIACGTDDNLIGANRKFRAWLKDKDVKHADVETPGAHTWMVWRRNLAAFTPLIFQNR